MKGYIYDWRKELDSAIWLMEPMYHRIWQYLKYRANHSKAQIPNPDATTATILPGQVVTSLRKISYGVGYYQGKLKKEPNVKTVRKILSWLENVNMITVKSNSWGTVITINNWELYQKNMVKGNTKSTEEKQLLDTNNKCKSNDNECIINSFIESDNIEKIIDDPKSISNQIAKEFISLILRNNPNARVPKKGSKQFENWTTEIEKLHRIDKREWDEISKVLKFSQSDNFWSTVILNPSKLRNQYDQLWLRMLKPNEKMGAESKLSRLKRDINNPRSELNRFLNEEEEFDE
ncbi:MULTISPECIES: hypothetical protein [unclassified Fusibacter]|uniref:hypothetical protein n=1 Tax=unclassified Fusibacter TaxID=2624464 RepID=UPI0010121008|nr:MULTISPECIES: hypothetical protein [unclassified Fusibacter]MCK8059727.1 hypothetical protein [Fusibacter sp. A2]NPE21528.1 hypothetical protein [Fusibacter sp. A1]RXV61938.1 hypothetical protein DWB64_06775 [Fusibacter sp. A1]